MSPVLPSREYISRSFSYRDNPSRVFGCCIGDTSLQNMGTEADWGDPVADPYHSYKIFAAGQGRYFPVDLSASSLCPNFRECKGQLDDAGRVLSSSAQLFLSAHCGFCMNRSRESLQEVVNTLHSSYPIYYLLTI